VGISVSDADYSMTLAPPPSSRCARELKRLDAPPAK